MKPAAAQTSLNSIGNGSLPLRGQPNLTTPLTPAMDADTSTTVESNASVTADARCAVAPVSMSSPDQANEIFGSGTDANFLTLAGLASQSPLNVFGGNETFGATLNSNPSSLRYPVRGAAIFSPARENNAPSVSSSPVTVADSATVALPGSSEQSMANETDAPTIVSMADAIAQLPVTAPPIVVTAGAAAAIGGASAESVTFAGSTGTLTLDDAVAFTGQVSGLAGSDAIDLADVSYGPNRK